jgi:hypothetical protein
MSLRGTDNKASTAHLAHALREVSQGTQRDLVALAADLGGGEVPEDPTIAFLTLVRGDLLGGQPRYPTTVPAGQAEKLGRFGRYRQTMDKLVAQSRRDPGVARALKIAMRQIDELVGQISGCMSQVSGRDAAALAKFVGDLDAIRRALGRYREHTAKLTEIDRFGVVTVARRKGKAGGQFVGPRGKKVTVSEIIEVLSGAGTSRQGAVRDAAEKFLRILALSDGWRASAGFHASPSDATTHVTIWIAGLEQFHLRVSKGKRLFDITWGKEGKPIAEFNDW